MGDPEEKVPQHLAPESVGQPSRALFLSYASEDAVAAERIATTLRGAGIQVWFDKSELRGGDAWDRHIRQQIHDCRLFIAVISAHTEARDEGYFRREWRLAVERAGDMAEGKAFLVPVVIDGTTERGASVPDKFRELQWTRLPDGETSPAFVQRVQRLSSPGPPITGQPATGGVATAPALRESSRASWWSKPAALAIVAVLGVALAYFVADKFWSPRHGAEAPRATSTAPAIAPTSTAAAFSPPPHSIAVLPFVNMSEDKGQEYFSDGLSEELLNSLARINELQVAARTSSFSFKGKDTDLNTIAHKLNVQFVLEGSVRRSDNMIRVTAQLNNAVTGFHLWSHTYDRSFGDGLKLQIDIANDVANALKVTVLGDIATKIKIGGTRNPEAYDAYLRASSGYWTGKNAGDMEMAITSYGKAARLDPNFALAFADWSIALVGYSALYATGPAKQDWLARARDPALKAISLAPDLAEGHLALAIFLVCSLDFARANEEFERAAALGPGDARVLKHYGRFAVNMGHTDAGLAALRRAVALDPLNLSNHRFFVDSLRLARRYDESVAASQNALSLFPDHPWQLVEAGSYYSLGDFRKARSLCDSKVPEGYEDDCRFWLALAYRKLGRDAEAETALKGLKASESSDGAYGYAEIYAQWGDHAKAIEWLETAVRLRSTDLQELKVEPLLDPLRNEPRFQAIQRALKFPP